MIKQMRGVFACFLFMEFIGCGSIPDTQASNIESSVTQGDLDYVEIPFNDLFSNFKAYQRRNLPDSFIVKCKIQITSSGPNESGLFMDNIGVVPVPSLGFVYRGRYGKGSEELYNILLVSDALWEENSGLILEDTSGRFHNGLAARIEADKIYNVYIKNKKYITGSSFLRIEKIDGLLSIDEIRNRMMEQKIERELAAVAWRAAQEEADRYDPNDFILVSPDFRLSQHKESDLFAVVADMEKVRIAVPMYYISDVTFVSQNGLLIEFTTDDRAISQNMKIYTRSGLTTGQKVRVYYTVQKNMLTLFEVVAIAKR
jgi:hypothetical protein